MSLVYKYVYSNHKKNIYKDEILNEEKVLAGAEKKEQLNYMWQMISI